MPHAVSLAATVLLTADLMDDTARNAVRQLVADLEAKLTDATARVEALDLMAFTVADDNSK